MQDGVLRKRERRRQGALSINPGMTLYCFEPSLFTFKRQVANAFSAGVSCHNLGLGSTAEEKVLFVFVCVRGWIRHELRLSEEPARAFLRERPHTLHKILPGRLLPVARYDQRSENFQDEDWVAIRQEVSM